MNILTIHDIVLSSLAELILLAGKLLSPSLCKRQIIVTEPRVNTRNIVYRARCVVRA